MLPDDHLLALGSIESSIPFQRPGVDTINILLQTAAFLLRMSAASRVD